jgi:hypothetical protein
MSGRTGGIAPSAARPTVGGSPLDGATWRFLSDELVPSLRRAGRTGLLSRVERAVARRDSRGLARLPERTRRELLEHLEAGIPPSRHAARAIVRLTSLVAQLPAPPARASWRSLGPAR